MSIQFEEVSFTYHSQQGLKKLNLTIQPGECLVLCGKSGCGKTTITRLLNGLIPELYNGQLTGQISLFKQSTNQLPIYQLAQLVGSVFQNPKTQFFTLDVRSELAFACENQGLPKTVILQRIAEVAALFEIDSLLDQKMFALSGGQKQLVAFASAYMNHPQVLVLDEPSSNLDFVTIEKIKAILIKVKQQGCTLIIAEHRLYYLHELADRFALIDEGQIKTLYSKEAFLELSIKERADLGLRHLALEQLVDSPTYPPLPLTTKELTIQHALVHYPKTLKPALQLTNLTFKSGETIGILGHNGAGKTTLANLLTGLLSDKKNQLTLDGSPVSAKERLLFSYLVMQDVNYQLFCETVEKELLLKAGTPERLTEISRIFDLENLLQRHPMSLSGGQKQRVAIATAILSGKKLLVLDEPTSGLDYFHMAQVSRILTYLRQQNIFIFVISHDLEFIQQACTELFTLKNGQLAGQKSLSRTPVASLIQLVANFNTN